MTNLLFSIVTVLVTNVSEITHKDPYGIYGGIILPSFPPQYPSPPPKTKSVYSTCHRITNRVDTLTGTPVTVELGRALVWSTTEHFTEVTTVVWKSSGVVTNEPLLRGTVTFTNGGGYSIQWKSNLLFRSQSLTVTNLLHVSTNQYTLEPTWHFAYSNGFEGPYGVIKRESNRLTATYRIDYSTNIGK